MASARKSTRSAKSVFDAAMNLARAAASLPPVAASSSITASIAAPLGARERANRAQRADQRNRKNTRRPFSQNGGAIFIKGGPATHANGNAVSNAATRTFS